MPPQQASAKNLLRVLVLVLHTYMRGILYDCHSRMSALIFSSSQSCEAEYVESVPNILVLVPVVDTLLPQIR